jgi:hypothetical protein
LGKKKQEKVCIMDLSPLLACLQRLQMLFFFFCGLVWCMRLMILIGTIVHDGMVVV